MKDSYYSSEDVAEKKAVMRINKNRIQRGEKTVWVERLVRETPEQMKMI